MRFVELEDRGRKIAERVMARTLARLPVSPTALTLTGVALNVGVAALLAMGYLLWAGGLLLLAALFDAADGALARVTRRQSDLGGFLDSTLDRCSEIIVGLGLLLLFLKQGAWVNLLLLYFFLTGSLLFSYIRARAEVAGFASRGGFFTRPVRIMVLAVGLFAGQIHVTLWVLAIGVQLSAFARLLGVCAEARRKAFPEAEPWQFRWFKGRAARPLLGEADDGESPIV